MSLIEKAKAYSELLKQLQSQSKEQKTLEDQKSSLEQELVDAMADEGVPQIKLENGMTLFRRTDTFWGAADGIEKEELVNVLANHPRTMDLIAPNYNANSLRSRVNEIVENGELDDTLARVLKKIEKPKIGYRN